MKHKLVTIKQAEELKNLGFNEETQYYHMDGFGVCKGYSDKWNEKSIAHSFSSEKGITREPYLAVPFVDDIIDWFNRKHNIKFQIRMYGNACEIVIWNNQNTINFEKVVTKNHYTAKRKIISQLIQYAKRTKSTTPETKEK